MAAPYRDHWCLNSARHSITEDVLIDPALTREAQLRAWLDSVEPKHCPQHKQTKLVLDRETSSRASQPSDNGPFSFRTMRAREGYYHFEAVSTCPACRCAYALCPPEFHETSFDTFDTSTPERARTLATARAYTAQVNTQGCGFAVFVGLTGPGKTRLACNILRALDTNNSLYIRFGELTLAQRATYHRKDGAHGHGRADGDHPNGDEAKSPLEIVQQVQFLVLDELGCTPLANDERLLLDELLKHRYDHRKPTVLISNLPLDELKKFLGDALADRIKHATGNGKFQVQFTGESYRRASGDDYLVRTV